MPPPARWEAYQPLGLPIPDTQFIAFKVPLKEEICRNLPEDQSFSPQQLIERIEESGKRLGLIVDLTFTRKYYNGQFFEKRNIQYEKIFTAGHEVPSDDVVQRFHEIIDDFSIKNTDEDVVIGVHCTHGVNRTGYLVCRYMIDRLRIDPEKAIEMFREARGHPIERENYLLDLRMRPLSSSTGARSSGWNRGGGEGGQQQQQHDSSQSDAEQRSPDKDDMSWKRSRSPRHHRGRGRGGQPRNGPFSRGDPAHRGGPSGRGRNRDMYSAWLEELDHLPQNGWGSAARSGWGSSSIPGEGYAGQGSPRGRAPQRHFHHQQNYNWRRRWDHPHPYADGPSYRDRTEDLPREGGSGWRELRGSGRSDRDRNWRQRGREGGDDDEGGGGSSSVGGRGRGSRGYQENGGSSSSSSGAQGWHSGHFRDRDGQMRGGWNGYSSAGGGGGGRGQGREEWNNGRWGWNDGRGGGSYGRNDWNNGKGGWNSGRGGGWNGGRGGGWHNGRGGWNDERGRRNEGFDGRNGGRDGRNGGGSNGRGGTREGDRMGSYPSQAWCS